MANDAQIAISPTELDSIDHFRKGQDTAVLTVMFTDIQGFTKMTEEKGEQYSVKVREKHDAVLKAAIEQDARGMIVKFIGDAVMAVFAEPSSAVQTALDIQEGMATLNKTEQEMDDIHVRIGLHMGQVSIENNLQVDVFGRHVNRASRIESLAQGGQILMSYSVFDSAKGWLGSVDDVAWAKHGDYQFKGIDDATTVYEVLNTTHGRKPIQPEGAISTNDGKAKTLFWRAATGVLAVAALGGLAWLASGYLMKPDVYLQNFRAQDVWVDNTQKVVTGDYKGSMKELLTNVSRGRHILHYDVNYITRYYAEIDVKSGDNYINPRWQLSRLPNFNVRMNMGDKTQHSLNEQKQFEYFEYNAEGKRVDHIADIDIRINSQKDEVQQAYVHQVHYTITLDGKQVVDKTLQVLNAFDVKENARGKSTEPVYKDNFHKFNHRYYASVDDLDFTVTGDLVEYSYLKR